MNSGFQVFIDGFARSVTSNQLIWAFSQIKNIIFMISNR